MRIHDHVKALVIAPMLMVIWNSLQTILKGTEYVLFIQFKVLKLKKNLERRFTEFFLYDFKGDCFRQESSSFLIFYKECTESSLSSYQHSWNEYADLHLKYTTVTLLILEL